MKFQLERVHFMPQELQEGVLYASEEFGAAAHLCACGCRSKIRTPLGPTEWSLEETRDGPTLRPSVGNWQKPCRSHYVIHRGEVHWAGDWTEEEVLAGRRAEEIRRQEHFESMYRRRGGLFSRLWNWVKSLFKS